MLVKYRGRVEGYACLYDKGIRVGYFSVEFRLGCRSLGGRFRRGSCIGRRGGVRVVGE